MLLPPTQPAGGKTCRGAIFLPIPILTNISLSVSKTHPRAEGPACGYRYRDDGQQLGRLPLDLGTGRCNCELLGSLLGAAAGGLAGSQIGDGRGQLAAVAGGTLLGFLMGGTIGRNMDEVDQTCVGQALEHAGDGQQIAWNNPQTVDPRLTEPSARCADA